MRDISQVYSERTAAKRKGQPLPKLNERQSALLDAWEAFLGEHPSVYEDMVHTIPNKLSELFKLAEKEAAAPQVKKTYCSDCMEETTGKPNHMCSGPPVSYG